MSSLSTREKAVLGVTWGYCPTKDNPADLLTCGVDFKYLSFPNCLWWKRPTWMTISDNWPKWQPQLNLHLEMLDRGYL